MEDLKKVVPCGVCGRGTKSGVACIQVAQEEERKVKVL